MTARRRPVLLSAATAALAAVLALVLPHSTASAASTLAAGNGVRAHHPVMIFTVRADQPVSAGEGRGQGLPQAQIAVGACVAPEDTSLADAAAACGGASFTAGTKVLLASGIAVPIARLRPGDKILATNTRTGKTSAEPVTAVLVHHDTNRYELVVKTAHGTAVIHTTSTHLFWDPYLKQWRPASKLRKGEHLKTAAGVIAVADGGITPKQHDGWMWDLTIAADHDFYIQAGPGAVLVHNCPVPGAGSDSRALESGYTEPTELHHVLPQQFRSQFENAGLNVDEATVRLPSSVHQAAHDVGWNAVWEDFFGANANPSGAEIVNQASHMMWEFGLDRYSLGVEPYG